jgi:hypothetical protein
MNYIILDTNPVIDGVETSNFVNILSIVDNKCFCNISNREATTYDVAITNNDVVTSVNYFFENL